MFSHSDGFSSKTDEELVFLAQSGVAPAEAFLLDRLKSQAEKTASVFYGKYSQYCTLGLLDKDDLYQEGLLGLLSAVYSYRPDKNTAFRTYASVCISNQIKAAIKSANSKKNLPFGSLLSIDDTVIPATESVEDLFIFNETEEVLNSFLQKELSALELSVIRLFLQDMSYKDISEKLNIPVKSVDNAIQRIRGKLRDFLTNDDHNSFTV